MNVKCSSDGDRFYCKLENGPDSACGGILSS